MVRRRKQNRKQSDEGIKLPPAFAVILGLAAAVSLSYLWFSGRCETLGVQIKKLEEQKIETHKRVLTEEYKWSNMKSPGNIEQILQKHHLVMTWPGPERVVRLRSNPETLKPAQVVQRREYAQHTGVVMND